MFFSSDLAVYGETLPPTPSNNFFLKIHKEDVVLVMIKNAEEEEKTLLCFPGKMRRLVSSLLVLF